MERESERSEAAIAEEAVAASSPEQPAETTAPEPAKVEAIASVDTTQFDAEMAKAASKLADLQAALLRIKLHDAT
jgi:hypothetical protein